MHKPDITYFSRRLCASYRINDISATASLKSAMKQLTAVTVHPDVQDGAPVFSGTRIRIETFADFMRIGVSISEFLNEFPSITRDQALEVHELLQQYALEQIGALVNGSMVREMPAA